MSRVLPILFNTEMVQANLDGRKTAARWICKDGNDYTVPDMRFYDANKRTYAVHNYADAEHTDKLSIVERACPICLGDILYVRETWAFIPCIECKHEDCNCLKPPVIYEDEDSISEGCFIYRADYPEPDRIVWYPSIHMPKKAARIWLKVTDVRVEKLQDITESQAKKEGFVDDIEYGVGDTARGHFIKYWNKKIKKKDIVHYGWLANPYVWVIEFERCEKPEREE